LLLFFWRISWLLLLLLLLLLLMMMMKVIALGSLSFLLPPPFVLLVQHVVSGNGAGFLRYVLVMTPCLPQPGVSRLLEE